MIETTFELRLTNKQSVFCESLETARDEFNKFIRQQERQGFGSSNLQRYAGDIRVDGKKVAHVSYNGRMWTPEKWPNAKEIILGKELK